ncbi:MAG: M56 family metallopeptidase [Victivallaceae bacterium]
MSEIVFLMLHSLAKGLVLVVLASAGLALGGARLSLRQQRWIYTAFVLALLVPLTLFKRELPLPAVVEMPPVIAPAVAAETVTAAPVAAAPVELPQITLPAVRQSWNWAALAGGVYLAVALLIFIRRLALILRWEAKTRRCPAIGDERLLRLAAEARELARYRGRARLLDGSGVLSSPGCFGLLRPKLLFPCDELRLCSDAEIRMFLLHEYTHLAAGDQRGTIFFYLLDAVLWFNPFYFALRRRLLRLWENICDETVIERCGNDVALKKSYARLVASLSIGESAVPGAALSGTAREIKNRMEGIMKAGSRKQNLCLTAALLTLGFGAALVLPGCGTAAKKVEIPVFTPPAGITPEEMSWKKFGPPTEKLVKEGKYEEALARYVWYYQNISKVERAEAGVKNSFVLYYWKEFGGKYPKALAVLRQLRAEKAELFLSGKAQLQYPGRDWKKEPAKSQEDWQKFFIQMDGDSWQFADITGIDRTLGEPEKSYQLFLELDQTQPAWAKKVWPMVESLVVDKQNFALALKYTPDFKQRWKNIQATMNSDINHARTNSLFLDYLNRDDFSRVETVLKIFRAGTKPEDIAFTRECVKELAIWRQELAKIVKESQEKAAKKALEAKQP